MPNQKQKSPNLKKTTAKEEPPKEAKAVAEEHKEFREEITEIKAFLQHFSGPLPPPDAFAKYEQTLEGAANRILTMAEKQQEHRQATEKKIVRSNIINEKLGLIFGIIVALAAIGSGAYCASIQQTWAAVVIGGGGVVGLITAFVQGSREIKREKRNKK